MQSNEGKLLKNNIGNKKYSKQVALVKKRVTYQKRQQLFPLQIRMTQSIFFIIDEQNRHNLELLERCLCVVCIDEDILPSTFNEPLRAEDRWINDRDYANVLHHAIHGGGSRHLGANRWFDKTFNAILGKVSTTLIKSTKSLIKIKQLLIRTVRARPENPVT